MKIRVLVGVMLGYVGLVTMSYAEAPQGEVSSQAESVTLSGYTPEGHKKWDLLADSAEIFPGGEDVNLKAPKGTLYEKGDPQVHLVAETGTYNPKNGNVVLQEKVLMKDEEGTEVKTNNLFWDSEAATLEMKSDIEMLKDNALITGRDLKIFKDKGLAILQKAVKLKAYHEVMSQHPSVITCSGKMEVNYKENYVEFFDNVVIADPKVNLKADHMVVYFDRKNKILDRVICDGHVLIVQDTKKAVCGHAEYDALEGSILLSQEPKVLKDGNVLTAETIAFYVQDEKVVCKPSAQLVLYVSEEDKAFFQI